MRPFSQRHLPILLLVLAAGCGGSSPFSRWAPARSAHETYAASLASAGLDTSAAGAAWLASARKALDAPQQVSLPFHETGYFDPAVPSAAGYRVELPRGRVLTASVTIESAQPGQLFIDLFRVTEGAPERVLSVDAGGAGLRYVSRADGAYIVRVQPELLRGGRYTIVQRTEASLRFPVDRAGDRDVQSVFGDARDGGRRDHHGVDIFAPRGTPVLAGAAGIVRSVDTTAIGGRVIWLSDTENGQSLYYAHLHDWAAREGQTVKAGDVIGYVGNTGNASSTAPHLHFGIYRGGPIDPLPSIRSSDRDPARPSGAVALIGRLGRLRIPAPLRPLSGAAGGTPGALPAMTAVQVTAATGGVFKVSLPDGREGFVDARSVVAADAPLRPMRAGAAADLREGPSPEAVVITRIAAGTRLPVLAEFSGYLLVETPEGRRGWLPPGSLIRTGAPPSD
ncbi:MAG: M23 family metallopeptidase [Acidobacteriota bacterium]|nr:M23 family metallopeptidase [Acidobacteriota bacterium]